MIRRTLRYVPRSPRSRGYPEWGLCVSAFARVRNTARHPMPAISIVLLKERGDGVVRPVIADRIARCRQRRSGGDVPVGQVRRTHGGHGRSRGRRSRRILNRPQMNRATTLRCQGSRDRPSSLRRVGRPDHNLGGICPYAFEGYWPSSCSRARCRRRPSRPPPPDQW